MSRRRALGWLGVLPWAAWNQACGEGGEPKPLEQEIDLSHLAGEIVGPSMELGHRLRTGDLPSKPDEAREVSVLVVGAGVAGLTAGWRLRDAGFDDFEILELEPEPGGNSRFGANAVSAYPWGAHYLPEPTAESMVVRRLLHEMGLVVGRRADGRELYDPRHLCHSPQERLFVGNRWQPGLSLRSVCGPEDEAEVEAFEARIRELRDRVGSDGRRAFTLPMELSSRDPELTALDEMSMAEDLNRRGFFSPRLRWYVEYCCRDDYGSRLDDTSAWAGWHYFCARPDDAEVLTWPEGNGRMVRHLADRAGDRLRLGQMVYRAEAVDGGWRVDAVDAGSGKATRYRCRRLIYALPRFTAPYLLRGVEPRKTLRSWTYSPWLVANLTIARRPGDPRWETAWDNVFYGSRSLGYVVANHQNLSSAPGDMVATFYLPLVDQDPVAARTALQEASWEQLAAEVIGDVAQAHPDISRRVRRLDLMLWAHAMIRPTPGFIWGEARQGVETAPDGLFYAHSDMSGLSLFEEASYRGNRAAEQVLASLGRAPSPLTAPDLAARTSEGGALERSLEDLA